MRKIVFFDIDGTITSEIDGSIPEDAALAIKEARKNGHLMFINSGRCLLNIEQRFKDIGFDGYSLGCGTNVFCDGKEIFYLRQNPEVISGIVKAARDNKLDISYESRDVLSYDKDYPLLYEEAISSFRKYTARGYDMIRDVADKNFSCDKFCAWYENIEQINEFRKVSDKYFEYIDREGNFAEFVPLGVSKATGMEMILKYYGLDLEDAIAIGDSNNDATMLSYVKHSVAMGNCFSEELLKSVSFVTKKSSEGGIRHALLHFGLI